MTLDNLLRDSQFTITAHLFCWCTINHFLAQFSDCLVNFDFFSKFRIAASSHRNFVSLAFDLAIGAYGDNEVRHRAYKRNIVRLQTKDLDDIVS